MLDYVSPTIVYSLIAIIGVLCIYLVYMITGRMYSLSSKHKQMKQSIWLCGGVTFISCIQLRYLISSQHNQAHVYTFTLYIRIYCICIYMHEYCHLLNYYTINLFSQHSTTVQCPCHDMHKVGQFTCVHVHVSVPSASPTLSLSLYYCVGDGWECLVCGAIAVQFLLGQQSQLLFPSQCNHISNTPAVHGMTSV